MKRKAIDYGVILGQVPFIDLASERPGCGLTARTSTPARCVGQHFTEAPMAMILSIVTLGKFFGKVIWQLW